MNELRNVASASWPDHLVFGEGDGGSVGQPIASSPAVFGGAGHEEVMPSDTIQVNRYPHAR
jgi:hypothetical protein